MVVQHNLRAMNSNRMLGLTASAQSKSTEKLSSGYKINRAADDAAGLSISEKMRKQIRGLSQASLNAADGISAVQTAEGALNEVQDMLQRMNELAVKASNGTMSEDDRGYIQDEINQLIDEIDRVAETTKFNETYLLKGDENGEKAIDFQYQPANVLKEDLIMVKDGQETTVTAGTYVDSLDTSATYFTKGTVAKQVGAAVTDAAEFTTATIINTDIYYKKDGNDFVLVNKGEKFVTGTTYYTVDFEDDGTVGAATAVTAGQEVTADGYFVGTTTIYDSTGTKLGTNTALGTTVVLTDYFTSVGKGKYDVDEAITDFTAYSVTAASQFTDKDGNEIAANGLYQYFDEAGNYEGSGLYINGRTAETADIEAYIAKGEAEVGSLELKLHVGADATSNNQISLKIEAMNASSLGIEEVRVDGGDDENALNAIETVKAALQKVSTQRSALGAVQNRLEHTIANLDNVVENTTAAESQIRDTDMASEMVKYSNNNILAQAGQAMLAQANQANQGVLSILG